jgi:hypothetical protein
MTVHIVSREALPGPPTSRFMNPIPPCLKKPNKNRPKSFNSLRRYIMSPEQEWEYEKKLDHLSYRLEELILEVFINVVQKLKDRNEPLTDLQVNSLDDDIAF